MKRRDFTFSIQADAQDLSELQAKIEQCPEWAWIIHDQDIKIEEGSGEVTPVPVHLHGFVAFPNPRSFASIADMLDIPVNQVQKVISRFAILRYLTHKDQPAKYQYNLDEVRTNIDLAAIYNLQDSSTLWENYRNLRAGLITPQAFFDAHKSEIDKNNFYQKMRIFQLIQDTYKRTPPEKPPRSYVEAYKKAY